MPGHGYFHLGIGLFPSAVGCAFSGGSFQGFSRAPGFVCSFVLRNEEGYSATLHLLTPDKGIQPLVTGSRLRTLETVTLVQKPRLFEAGERGRPRTGGVGTARMHNMGSAPGIWCGARPRPRGAVGGLLHWVWGDRWRLWGGNASIGRSEADGLRVVASEGREG